MIVCDRVGVCGVWCVVCLSGCVFHCGWFRLTQGGAKGRPVVDVAVSSRRSTGPPETRRADTHVFVAALSLPPPPFRAPPRSPNCWRSPAAGHQKGAGSGLPCRALAASLEAAARTEAVRKRAESEAQAWTGVRALQLWQQVPR